MNNQERKTKPELWKQIEELEQKLRFIEKFLRNCPKYSIRFAFCIVKKYNIIEQTRRKCKKYLTII